MAIQRPNFSDRNNPPSIACNPDDIRDKFPRGNCYVKGNINANCELFADDREAISVVDDTLQSLAIARFDATRPLSRKKGINAEVVPHLCVDIVRNLPDVFKRFDLNNPKILSMVRQCLREKLIVYQQQRRKWAKSLRLAQEEHQQQEHQKQEHTLRSTSQPNINEPQIHEIRSLLEPLPQKPQSMNLSPPPPKRRKFHTDNWKTDIETGINTPGEETHPCRDLKKEQDIGTGAIIVAEPDIKPIKKTLSAEEEAERFLEELSWTITIGR